MANWSNPTLTSSYTNFVTEVKDRDVEVALWFEGMSPTNLPTNAKRLNTSTGRFEKWNGSAWVDAVATFTFPALSVAGALTISGGIANNPTLTAGTANGVAYLDGSKVLTSGTALTFDGTSLGVGTNSPSSYGSLAAVKNATGLTVVGVSNSNAAANDGAKFSSFYGTTEVASLGHYWDGSQFLGRVTSLGDLLFLRNGSEQARLTSTGLGIGTNSPGAKLDVNGNVQIKGGGYQLFLNSDNTNYYYLQNNGSAGAANPKFDFVQGGVGTRMTLDSAGNLGLGVTPSAWYAGGPTVAQQIGANLTLFSLFGTRAVFASNYYLKAGTGADTYIANGYASQYHQEGGAHRWFTAPSGTAGNAISFTQAMTLDASGRLGVGTTSPVGRFSVVTSGDNTTVAVFGGQSGGTSRGLRIATGIPSNGSNNEIAILDAQSDQGVPILAFQIAGNERARIDSAGNLIAASTVTGYWQIPRGTTAQRPTGATGMIRFNSDLGKYEGHNGTLWSSIGGGATGGGSDDIFQENGQTVTTNYTITTNKNAMSAGAITIASGVVVTVPSGSTWVVV